MLIKKFVILVVLLAVITALGLLIIKENSAQNITNNNLLTPVVIKNKESPFKGLLGDILKPTEPVMTNTSSTLVSTEDKLIAILLLGIDRRSKQELGYRTDTMIYLIVNSTKNVAVMISVPRDLWVGGNRINAVYNIEGWEQMQKSFETITGIKPERFVLTDFADFAWVVDAMSGVPVTVETSFEDSQYPVDATKEYQTISFTKGEEILTGERALIYARSRKGSNGEGSDWMRMKRQHLILKGMLKAVVQPKSLFNPMNVENALKLVTTNRMDTNLSLVDAQFLWDMYKDKDLYQIKSLYLDSEYVFNPPMEDYGGAWVLVPQAGGYENFHKKVKTELLLDTPTVTQQ